MFVPPMFVGSLAEHRPGRDVVACVLREGSAWLAERSSKRVALRIGERSLYTWGFVVA